MPCLQTDKLSSEHLLEIQEERQMVKGLVDSPIPTDETIEAYNKRMKRREEFTARRKAHHDKALDHYKEFFAVVADECAAEVQLVSEDLKACMGKQDHEISALLCVMEFEETDHAGEAIMSAPFKISLEVGN
ncbi:hypothetical protein Pmar_PMAR008641 [Perkinsus marinus ATCC 50983]|uniref:Uncharacterized protein n=1 Tax=Perkinsus marinus (strain ATCC 50983 / TXsc) TaxID=423536 RepID=C5L277_PERM5|nr:hypothetical protein Pmar_PMAR008641 [Perkinsus marinus ATCC 50983]EER09166.1 hypothetical protein Pmar_PMAR008641 [Perkinsus marinus ATCC 50983]|eukprot:XP_002777350.1 hypothetical protein Pmar_PMAR008641 [Perkinsus marinus ATCC 50983]